MVKKLLLATIAIGIIFWICISLLIPDPLQVSSIKYLKAPIKKVEELATDPLNWQRWWPGNHSNNSYSYHSYSYTVISQKPYTAQIGVQTGKDSFTTYLTILPLTGDSVVVEWKTELVSGINPFTRIKNYNKAMPLKQDLETLLDSLIAFSTNQQKLYGLQIEKTRFTNPFMITTQATFSTYPTVDNIYTTIHTLRAFAQTQQAQPVDSPMVNIEPSNANNYLLRVALPINKKLDATGSIGFKQMVLGNTLLGTVTGGRSTTEEALRQMQIYISDFKFTSPAIPFEVLITNRQQQPDSSKWITKIYYPIY